MRAQGKKATRAAMAELFYFGAFHSESLLDRAAVYNDCWAQTKAPYSRYCQQLGLTPATASPGRA
jgi:hypothetical protein